jgi:drug/metabolite transporter (DMT)-like permease
VWGLIWYPYRALEADGIPGVSAAVLTYLVALVIGAVALRRWWIGVRPTWLLALIGLAAGGCNLGYVLATLEGEVMRVLLLFYLAPLWTVLLARLLLGEAITAVGLLVIALSLAGAAVMLWRPGQGSPLPGNPAEWIGLAAGLLFALSNVLIRKTHELPIELKSLAVFAGVVLVGLALLPLRPESLAAGSFSGPSVLLLLLLGVTLYAVNLVVQYGLTRVCANQAIVILLFELVVAAASSWLLAQEVMSAREWIGGAMIVAASLCSGRLAQEN